MPKPAKPGKTAKSQETAVLFVSDVHIGKRTKTFTLVSLRKRLDAFAQKVAGVHALLGSGYEFDKLVVCLLGDVIDGSGIYPTQAHHQDETSALAQVEFFAEEIRRFVLSLAAGFPEVQVECVGGNHGRTSHLHSETDNWDLMAYTCLRAGLRGEDNVRVRFGGKEGLWLRKVAVRRHKYLLYHGHGIKMSMGIPWYGVQTRLTRWATTKEVGPFDVYAQGHFHSCGMMKINRINAFMTGTAVTGDEWGLETLGYESSNDWWLVGSSDKHPVTFQMPLTV